MWELITSLSPEYTEVEPVRAEDIGQLDETATDLSGKFTSVEDNMVEQDDTDVAADASEYLLEDRRSLEDFLEKVSIST